MKDKAKQSRSQLLNFAEGSYLERTSRPIYALAFLLPLIIIYELGTIFTNTNVLRHYWQGRVVAFAWVQKFLEHLGFAGKLAWVTTPLAVVVILIALQLTSGKGWRVWIKDIGPMAIECIVLAIPLIVLGLLATSPGSRQSERAEGVGASATIQIGVLPSCSLEAGSRAPPARQAGSNGRATKLTADIITAIGAGIYEELVFRLVLICLLMLLFQNILRLSHKNSIVLSVLVSAAMFGAYHHIDFFTGQLYQRAPFDLTEFAFRTIAGIYFAVVFAIRGFGITAGTHAFYDVIATVINAVFFSCQNQAP
jgi:membrane protease YdiL (CAAX protease family)